MMMSIKNIFSILALVCGAWALGSMLGCQKEVFTTSSSDKLSFSVDTLRFDTVFTQLGSATRIFKAYNASDKSIRIAHIHFENEAQTRFRMNVDGLPGTEFHDVEIAPNDSLYIFAAVTVNPDEPLSSSPFVLEEKLVFETNGNIQKVQLEAWGQNANYLPSRFYADSITALTCNGAEWVWDDPKPYVIYGILVIDDCKVRIAAGTHVYVHGGLAKIADDTSVTIYNDGFIAFSGNSTLTIEGTKDNPVVIQGDRLEPEFAEVPGQWTGIWLQTGTKVHQISHCEIKNSILGIRVDSAAELNIRNSKIYNTAGPGLLGIHAKIDAENCLFYNNVNYSVQLSYGGEYNFTYCTAASYGVDGEALSMSNVNCKNQDCMDFAINPLNAHFRNCIFTGSRSDQVSLFDRTEDNGNADFTYNFEHCLVRVKDLIKPNAYPDFLDFCQPCINVTSQDTIFVDPNDNVFYLDTLASRANGYGMPIPNILTDLELKLRHSTMPDVGCFEMEF